MAIPPLNKYGRYPRMAHWFNPILLFKLLVNVILSSIFGSYADRRLMIAALDTPNPQVLLDRAKAFKDTLAKGADDAIWLDFVADLGDGFDSTYAVASLLAKESLQLAGQTLPRGQVLIMGGDEVYPKASENAYRYQLRMPYVWAFPDPNPDSEKGVPLFAVPGNHDWYDGLVLFLAYFCGHKATRFGGWRAEQRRSYFAIQVTETWWLWAIDIQLADNIDQPQFDYFTMIAQGMPPDSKIILCSAEPGWLYTDTNSKSWDITDYALGIASEANKNLTIPVLLSGDTHHYSRYVGPNNTQFITSGGGGAFLHPTHQLESSVVVNWVGTSRTLGLAAAYPSFDVSRQLVWRNLLFAIKNWDFSVLMGLVYWLLAIAVTLRDQWDMYLFIAVVFGWSLTGYTTNQEKSYRPAVLITSALHALAHILVVISAARWFATYNDSHFALTGAWYSNWKWLGLLLVEMFPIGFLVGGSFFGWNMMLTCRYLRMNRNDAFSALRIGAYNNFMRLKIKEDSIEAFAVGLENVPDRDDWMLNPKHKPNIPNEPRFIPRTPLQPHLIEKFRI
ncbi:metallophosphoesterase [Bradyrhizobium sp. AZCC 1693]|uniref:metallophosphoesterase n=1 Tax=Bradyrhizobium sp. AZCC 1693 TaxID=3117029 RepID=UPI002FEFA20A